MERKTEPTPSQDVLEAVPAWGATLAQHWDMLEARVVSLEGHRDLLYKRVANLEARIETIVEDLQEEFKCDMGEPEPYPQEDE